MSPRPNLAANGGRHAARRRVLKRRPRGAEEQEAFWVSPATPSPSWRDQMPSGRKSRSGGAARDGGEARMGHSEVPLLWPPQPRRRALLARRAP